MAKKTNSRKPRGQEIFDNSAFEARKMGEPNLQIGEESQTQLEVRFIESQGNLSASRKRLLNQILSEPHKTFFLSSREMAKRYGVDSSTIVRTVQAMGYVKFADFVDDLRNHFCIT